MRGTVLVAVTGLVAALAAQERRPAFVVAHDAQGRPLAGASITCFASPAFGESSDEVDVVEGIADAHGLVVAKLLAHRMYSAFAIQPVDAGSFLASDMQENVAAGANIVLPVVVERAKQRIALEGQAAWQHVGPLTLAIAPAANNRWLLPMQEWAPRLPGIACAVVLDAKGQPLWSLPFAAFQPGPRALDEYELKVPAPVAVRVRVQSPDGAPIANATVSQAIEPCDLSTMVQLHSRMPRPAWRSLGCTGADGMLEVQLAVATVDGKVHDDLLLRAHAEGRAYGVGGVGQELGFDGTRQYPMTAGGVFPITLAPARRLRVHPAGAYEVVLTGRAAGRVILRLRDEEPVTVTTDAAGQAELPLDDAPDMVRVARMQRAGERAIWSLVANVDGDSWVGSAPPEVRVLVTDAGRNPACGQQLVLIPWLFHGPGFDVPMVLDQGGRTKLRINKGTWFLWCRVGDEAAWRIVDFDQPPQEIALQMQPVPRATLSILDAAGEPRAHRRVSLDTFGRWDTQNASPETTFLSMRQFGFLGSSRQQITTDAEGCLHYLMLPLPGLQISLVGVRTPEGVFVPAHGVLEPGNRIDIVVK